jgi:hypothetical protein
MTARKHSETIKIWADNDNSVVLLKTGVENWIEVKYPAWANKFNYLVCLEKHKKSVLSLLNGGEAELLRLEGEWVDIKLPKTWQSACGWYMSDSVESRVKTKKQTRYAYMDCEGFLTLSYDSIEELKESHPRVAASDNFKLIAFTVEM